MSQTNTATADPNAAAATAPATAPKAKAAAPDTKPLPIPALLSNQWKARESGVYFNTFEVVPTLGTPIENLTRPEFWANVSAKMKPGDTLIVLARDASYYVELLVWDAGLNWAQVSYKSEPLRRPEFKAPGTASEFEVARDPTEGYVVRRKDTGAKIKGGFANHEDARKWIIDYSRALRS